MELKVLDHGYVRYMDHMGSDASILQAARVSYKSKGKGEEADRKLLRYLFRRRHTSPFEMGKLQLNVKMPIFVMRQWVRHRMQNLNEVSARYTELPSEFHIPTAWRQQDTKNKQGSVDVGEFNPAITLNFGGVCFTRSASHQVEALCDTAYDLYETLIAAGVAREQVRMVLPLNIYTEIVTCFDVHNLVNLLVKRRDKHAQQEIRVFADAVLEIAKVYFPWTMEEYIRCEKSMLRVWGDDEVRTE